ncbi:unnamed protein product [Closterium sp. NIES-65]|nr:unnamed protein product [Closterium sp. NIES-65]
MARRRVVFGSQASFTPPLVTLAAVLISVLVATPVAVNAGPVCDYANGTWVRAEGYAAQYTGKSCAYAGKTRNCEKNGQTSFDYRNYKWVPGQPECSLSRFDAASFLSLLRGKVVALAGDSMINNLFEAIRCLVSAATPAPDWKGTFPGVPGDYEVFEVPKYGTKFIRIQDPFLVDSKPAGTSDSSSATWTINLDKPSPLWASLLKTADVFVFAHGHWFDNAPASKRLLYQKGQPVQADQFEAARLSLITVASYLTKSNYKGQVFYLTYSPRHYSSAFKTKGMGCAKATAPFTPSEGEYAMGKSKEAPYLTAQKAALKPYPAVRVLDIFRMALLRPDAHVGPWDGKSGNGDDCSHWCEPGLPDIWADLLFNELKNGGAAGGGDRSPFRQPPSAFRLPPNPFRVPPFAVTLWHSPFRVLLPRSRFRLPPSPSPLRIPPSAFPHQAPCPMFPPSRPHVSPHLAPCFPPSGPMFPSIRPPPRPILPHTILTPPSLPRPSSLFFSHCFCLLPPFHSPNPTTPVSSSQLLAAKLACTTRHTAGMTGLVSPADFCAAHMAALEGMLDHSASVSAAAGLGAGGGGNGAASDDGGGLGDKRL